MPFAGLHQLLYPLADRFGLLPPPQRKALLAAFGCADGPALQVFVTAIATLELLADTAAGRGLLVAVDDLHWIDDATTQVLGFVARRIASEPIALLAATRPGFEDPFTEAGLPELGRPEQAGELAGSAEPLSSAPSHLAWLTLIREALSPGVPGDPLRVGILADLASEMINAGQARLAFRLMLAAAVRVWSADPGPATRDYLIATMARLPVSPDDPRLLAAGGFVDPARYGDLITRRIADLRPDRLA